MSSERRGVWFWLSAWGPVAVGVGVIAMESTPTFGSDRTSGPLRWLVQLFIGAIGDTAWDLLHHYIRKTGHFVGYGTLGLLWLRAWRMSLPGARFLSAAVLALLGTALVASWDEWHQTFLPNRTGTPWDVVLDCCGAAIMLLIVYGFRIIFRPQRPAHK